MKILRGIEDFRKHVGANDIKPGCLADTSFLYALSYDDDRLYNSAVEISDLLAEMSAPIYANVISRMEFVDLIFRKQITIGAVKLFETLSPTSVHKDLFNLLKNIRDQDTAHKRKQMSFKIGERQFKDLKADIEKATDFYNWKTFCAKYAGQKLFNEWEIMEQELGLNFIEIMEGQVSNHFEKPLNWSDMVQIIAEQGVRAPDAMIANLFLKSKFPILVTGDSDFETSIPDTLQNVTNKAILFL